MLERCREILQLAWAQSDFFFKTDLSPLPYGCMDFRQYIQGLLPAALDGAAGQVDAFELDQGRGGPSVLRYGSLPGSGRIAQA